MRVYEEYKTQPEKKKAQKGAKRGKRVPTIRELIAKHQIPLPSESDSQLEIDRMTGKRISME